MDTTKELDVRGLGCAMRLVKVRVCLKRLEIGHFLKIVATTDKAASDLKSLCKHTGNEFVDAIEIEGEFIITLKKLTLQDVN